MRYNIEGYDPLEDDYDDGWEDYAPRFNCRFKMRKVSEYDCANCSILDCEPDDREDDDDEDNYS